jgi:hypothetical protein
MFTNQANQIDPKPRSIGNAQLGWIFRDKNDIILRLYFSIRSVNDPTITKQEKNEILKKVLRKTQENFENSQREKESVETEALLNNDENKKP